uniref:Uncharacterized protein n=1 Tax=Engystomops pustulosus TaxID=76066 RepID=A0AAV6YTP4_ENGPU|nr:hypothetical protein GDO81_022941 [Engystomops pustulosus]
MADTSTACTWIPLFTRPLNPLDAIFYRSAGGVHKGNGGGDELFMTPLPMDCSHCYISFGTDSLHYTECQQPGTPPPPIPNFHP